MLKGGSASLRHLRMWVLGGVSIPNSPMKAGLTMLGTSEGSKYEATQKEGEALRRNDKSIQ